jgi:hypothetical protein
VSFGSQDKAGMLFSGSGSGPTAGLSAGLSAGLCWALLGSASQQHAKEALQGAGCKSSIQSRPGPCRSSNVDATNTLSVRRLSGLLTTY